MTEIRAFRRSLGLNQTSFWGAVCVDQSAASRYERGNRRIPKAVTALLRERYGWRKDGPTPLKTTGEIAKALAKTPFDAARLEEALALLDDARKAMNDAAGLLGSALVRLQHVRSLRK